MDFTTINDQTGFAQGALFKSEAEVRRYFTAGVQRAIFGADAVVDPFVLGRMADAVIGNGWHLERGALVDVSIEHDGEYQGTWSAAEVRANNADQPEILEALDKLEAGERVVWFNGGAGGVTELRLRRELEPPRRRALASYRGTLAEVRAASDADAELVDAVEGRR